MSVDPSTHRAVAIEANNATWERLGRPEDERTPADAEEMTRRAYAAAYHWDRAEGSGPANTARADWLLARVWAVRGEGTLALHHARRCLHTCDTAGLTGFDLAYAQLSDGPGPRLSGRRSGGATAPRVGPGRPGRRSRGPGPPRGRPHRRTVVRAGVTCGHASNRLVSCADEAARGRRASRPTPSCRRSCRPEPREAAVSLRSSARADATPPIVGIR